MKRTAMVVAVVWLLGQSLWAANAKERTALLRDAVALQLHEDWDQATDKNLAFAFLSCKPFSIQVDGSAASNDLQVRTRYSEFLEAEVRSVLEEKVRTAKEDQNFFYPAAPVVEGGSVLRAVFLLMDDKYDVSLMYQKRVYDPISKESALLTTWEIPLFDGVAGGEQEMFEDLSKYMAWFLQRYGAINTAEKCAPIHSNDR